MLTCEFLDEAAELPVAERAAIEALAVAAYAAAAELLPLSADMHLVISPTLTAIPGTGDNAYTESPERIHWFYDKPQQASTVARRHLRQAFFHEAFHAARFQRLPHEAGLERWSNVALGEGLACVFAREHAHAHEEWCSYDPAVMPQWSRQLFSQPWGEFHRWKFLHEDGRSRIAFRVGVWLVDEILRTHDWSIADLVWMPLEELEALPQVHRHIQGAREAC